MSAKPRTAARPASVTKTKSVKKPLQAKSVRVARVKHAAKAKRYRVPTQSAPGVRTRTSLVGAKIYPASVEPSKRAKKVVEALAGPSFAA
jgi:hypothetical protein